MFSSPFGAQIPEPFIEVRYNPRDLQPRYLTLRPIRYEIISICAHRYEVNIKSATMRSERACKQVQALAWVSFSTDLALKGRQMLRQSAVSYALGNPLRFWRAAIQHTQGKPWATFSSPFGAQIPSGSSKLGMTFLCHGKLRRSAALKGHESIAQALPWVYVL